MQNEKTIALVILGLVAIIALTGFMLIGIDINAKASFNPLSGGLGGDYSEDAAEWNWQSYTGGRGRRFIEDAAANPNFDPRTARRGQYYMRRHW